MTFEEACLMIPQYLANQLTDGERAAFEEQLNVSPALRDEMDALRPLWTELGELPEAQPSAAMRARFYRTLNAIAVEPHSEQRSVWSWRPLWVAAAAGLALFLGGIAVGRYTFRQPPQADELAQLQQQVQSLHQMVALSLLGRQSATARLEGVSWGSRVTQPDRQVTSALLLALNHDPNVNVRLSSADALEKFADDPTVRRALIDSIPVQESPLVQIALIDTLVQIHNGDAASAFRELARDANANANVRQRARWALQKLSSQ